MIKLHAGLDALCNLAQAFLLLLLQIHSNLSFPYITTSNLEFIDWKVPWEDLDGIQTMECLTYTQVSLNQNSFIHSFIYEALQCQKKGRKSLRNQYWSQSFRVIECDCSTGSVPPLSQFTWSSLLYCLKACCQHHLSLTSPGKFMSLSHLPSGTSFRHHSPHYIVIVYTFVLFHTRL